MASCAPCNTDPCIVHSLTTKKEIPADSVSLLKPFNDLIHACLKENQTEEVLQALPTWKIFHINPVG